MNSLQTPEHRLAMVEAFRLAMAGLPQAASHKAAKAKTLVQQYYDKNLLRLSK